MQPGSKEGLGASEQLSALIQSSPVAIYSVDRDGMVTTWNRGAERTFGWTAEEVMGKRLPILPPEGADESAPAIRSLTPGGFITDLEAVRIRKDGSRINVSLSAGTVFDSTGAITGTMAVAVDTTERKRAETELRKSETSLRMAQRVARLGSWELDPVTGNGLWSAEMFRLLGRPLEAGTPTLAEFHELIHPDDQASTAEMERRIFQGVTDVEELEYRTNPLLGPIRYLSAHLERFRDAHGRPEKLVGTLLDVTERKEAALRLERSERSYRELVENLDDVVYSIDLEGRFSYVSPAIRRLGVSPDDFLGQPFAQFVHPDDLDKLRATFERCLAGDSFPQECRVIAGDKAATVRVLSRRVLDDAGRVVGATGVMVDVTQQRATEERLRLSQRLEALGRLAGGVAHDFNNLLTAIISYSDLALGAIGPEGRGWNELQQIRRAGTRASELTRQLLAFGRKQVLQPRVLSLNEVLTSMRSMLERLIPEVELVFELAPDLGNVRADPGQIEQVIVNLVVNARDAMPQGGTITLSTRNAELPAGMPQDRPAPARLIELAVADTGMGIDELTLSHIFEPFFTTKRLGYGSGLGLATVYGIVEQSGGSVSVRSRLGEGATFTVHLPRDLDVPERASDPLAPPVGSSCGSETVLVVDDDAAVLGVAARVLTAVGYTVLGAASPDAALLVCQEHPGTIELLLTDVVMPGMNGPELARRCLSMRPGLVVVLMSGYADSLETQLDPRQPSLTDLIAKPFSAGDLATRIRAALERKRS